MTEKSNENQSGEELFYGDFLTIPDTDFSSKGFFVSHPRQKRKGGLLEKASLAAEQIEKHKVAVDMRGETALKKNKSALQKNEQNCDFQESLKKRFEILDEKESKIESEILQENEERELEEKEILEDEISEKENAAEKNAEIAEIESEIPQENEERELEEKEILEDEISENENVAEKNAEIAEIESEILQENEERELEEKEILEDEISENENVAEKNAEIAEIESEIPQENEERELEEKEILEDENPEFLEDAEEKSDIFQEQIDEEESRADEEPLENLESAEDFEELSENPPEMLEQVEEAEKSAEIESADNSLAEDELRKLKEEYKLRVRRPLGMKMMLIVSFLMLIALCGVTVVVSYFMTKDVRINAEENNLTINSRTVSSVESYIKSTISSVNMFVDMVNSSDIEKSEIQRIESMFFMRSHDVASVFLSKGNRLFVSSPFVAAKEIDKSNFQAFFEQESSAVKEAGDGSFVILNASPYFSVPTMAFFYKASDEGAVGVICSTEELSENFSSGTINQSSFLNGSGAVIIHGDISMMMSGASEMQNPLVKESLSGNSSNKQMTFKDSFGNEYIGAFRKLKMGDGVVLTTVRSSIVLEGIRRTTIRNIFITMAVLSLSLMVIYFFSKSISSPLKVLTRVVNEVNRGDFNTVLFDEINPNRKDEIGVLAKSTLHEREILNMVSSLTNKGVTRSIIRKEIDFEPHLKDITIFFSDIRGFTAISDGFKKKFGEQSAANIIGFLNDYMSRMVTCIRRTGGTVDKFEGDAIMACWGVLRNDDLRWETMPESSAKARKQKEHDQYITQDALSAVKCCIAMRYSLMKYNKDAEIFTKEHAMEKDALYKPHIQIGAGLNSGRATVGFMGSMEKMEFTSIGDAVNFASRTEASNKPCGTDILITEDTFNLLKDYIRCEENNFFVKVENLRNEIIVEQIPVEFEVKGKGKQHFYGVVNMPQFDIQSFFEEEDPDFELDADCVRACGPCGPRTLSEVRRILGIKEPNFGEVNLDAEENKIQVANP